MENSKFNLSKGEEKKSYKFNLTKEIAPTTNSNVKPPPKSKWWIWVLSLGIIVVSVVFFFMHRGLPPDHPDFPPLITTTGETATSSSESASAPAPSGETPTGAPQTPSGQPAESARSTSSGQQATVPSNQPATSASTPPQGTVEEKALKVIRGDFGNGAERKQLLGNEYQVIQQRVNEMYRDGIVQ